MNYQIPTYPTYAVTSKHELKKGVFQKITRTYVVKPRRLNAIKKAFYGARNIIKRFICIQS